jgi:hypothetical protein
MNIIFSLILCVGVSTVKYDTESPDLKSKNDLKSLGIGRIIEKDNSIISQIGLFEVHEFWIVYSKNESLHEIRMTDISRIEFKKSKWGFIQITFNENLPIINRLDQ